MLTERSIRKAIKPILLPSREVPLLGTFVEAPVLCLASIENIVNDIHPQEKLAIRKNLCFNTNFARQHKPCVAYGCCSKLAAELSHAL